DPLTCAVLARETLDGWLQALADVGLHPARVIPEALLLPWPDEEGWSLWLTGERAVLRHAPLAGFACPRAALPALLACVLAEAPAAPPRLFVWGETAPALGLECVPVAGHPFEAAAGAPAPISRPGTYTFQFRHGGLDRKYMVHVPRRYEPTKPMPVLLSFHGGGGHMEYQASDERYGQIGAAEAEGFIV
ncbi:MAG: hypothetical protein JNG88_19570, partial [Phycisphaerales bacterium]|nr:hypothetical protein [Phycisphaerales bacterium]